MTLIPLCGARVKDEDSKTLGPMSIPRAAAEEDEYRGYTIPRGCTVILNQWALNNDELYPDPFTFNPNRWIDNLELPQPFKRIGGGVIRIGCDQRRLAVSLNKGYRIWKKYISIHS